MTRRIVKLLTTALALCLLLAVIPFNAFAAETVPSGYTAISTPEQLDLIRNNLSGKYILTADITLTESWEPLGYTSSTNYTKFSGIIDGNGHTISGYKAKGNSFVYYNTGTIKNLTLSGTSTYGATQGIFCVYNEGTIQNCHNQVSVTSTAYTQSMTYTGGIVLSNKAAGIIEYCSNRADLNITIAVGGSSMSDKGIRVGGIAGVNSGTIRMCWNTGNITVTGRSGTSGYAAGIVGYGEHNSSILNCYNSGTLYSKQDFSSDFSYNYGAAGIMCSTYGDSIKVNITNCYNAGNCSVYAPYSARYVGGITGYAPGTVYSNCYFMSGTATNGSYSSTPKNVTKLTANQMYTQEAFAGFDFNNVWSMGSGSYRYPILVPGCTHTVDKVAAKPATCTTDGNIQYWYCNVCDKCFTSSSKYTQISKSSTVIPGGHSWTEAEELEERLVAGTGTDCQTLKKYYYGCANCDAVSDSETFDGTTYGSHQMATDWSAENDKHFHPCTVTGCTYKEDEDDCDGGTASCTAKAICSTCQNAYGNALPHNWKEEMEIESRIVPGSGADCQTHLEFYYGCTECEAVSDTEKFTGSGVGNHQMSTDWSFENDTHFHTCTVTNCTHRKDEAPCAGGTASCTAKAVCDTCENAYGSTLPHVWEEKEEVEARFVEGSGANCQQAKEYYYGCTGCDAVSDTEKFAGSTYGDHVISTQWTASRPTARSTEPETHYHGCTVTGCTYREDEAPCAGGAATCSEKAICDTCKTAYGNTLPHTWDEEEELEARLVSGSGADCQHAKEYYIGCTECEAVSDTEKFTGTTAGAHQMSTQWNFNNEQHFHGCTVSGCTHKEDAANHVWADATCTDPKTCSICGATSGEALDHTPGQWQKDKDNHWKVCSAEGCDEILQKAAHEDKDNTGECDTCGMTMAVANPEMPATGDIDLLPAVLLLILSGTACVCLIRKLYF